MNMYVCMRAPEEASLFVPLKKETSTDTYSRVNLTEPWFFLTLELNNLPVRAVFFGTYVLTYAEVLEPFQRLVHIFGVTAIFEVFR